MNNLIRINMLGGPGAGKSSTSAWLFSELKALNKPIELVSEHVKKWVYINRKVEKWDQCYLWSKQLSAEFVFLNGGKNIITDSPTLLAPIYARIYYPETNMDIHLKALNLSFEEDYPSLNIFLNRNNKPYDSSGRWQTHEQAKEIDKLIQAEITDRPNTFFFDYNNRPLILSKVLEYL